MTKIASALQGTLTVYGDLSKPVPPGAVFAVLPSAEELRADETLASLPYPPVVEDGSNCIFDPAEKTLQSTVWGRVVVSSKGIRVKPAWKMSHDKMLLSLNVDHMDFEGNPMTLERIRSYTPKVLEEVVVAMDFSGVEEALDESAQIGETVVVAIARGSFPEEGRDAFLELKFNAGPAAGTLREDGSMDFRERADLHSVAEGDLLGKLFPAENGTFGSDLFGNPIKPEDVHKLKVNVGQGVDTTLTEEGVVMYTASRTGVARYRNDLLEVSELLEIPGDVDFSTGNIHAEHGSIHIRGDVKCGFSVDCAGDVVIDGVVEEANISAGGLIVAGGVIMNGSNVIRAEGDVSAHFFRNAIIEAGGNVNADQELSHCKVNAGGEVVVLGSMGIISGGHIVSAEGITASVIGNKACAETRVEILLPSATEDKLKVAKKEFEKELAELDRAIGVDFELSKVMNAPEADRRILAELIKVRGRIQKEMRSIEEAREAELEEARKNVESKRIKAERVAHCGVEVVICGKGHTVKRDINAPSFSLDIESQQVIWA